MWRIFSSAFARKVAYLLAALIFGLVFGRHAHSQTVLSWSYYGTDYPTTGSVTSAVAAYENGLSPGSCPVSAPGGPCDTFVAGTCSPISGPPTTPSDYTTCGITDTTTGNVNVITFSFGAHSGCTGSLCAGACNASGPPQDLLATIAGGSSAPGGNICYNGCTYANGNSTTQVIVGNSNWIAGAAIPTGVACGGGGTGTNGTAMSSSNCVLKGGNTTCVNDGAGQAIVNNDIVQPSTAPANGNCVSYASGGVACTVSTTATPGATPPTPASPPVPDNGTAGTPATPTAVVQQGSTVVNYYNSSTVNNSSAPTGAKGTGAGTPAGASAATGTGTGSSGDGPGSCDGASPPAGCTGTLPSLDRTDTVASNVEAMLTGISNTPFIAGVSAIGTAMPSGSCPPGTVSLSYLHTSVNFTSTMCTIFDNNLASMQLIADVIWALIAVLIVMTA